MLDPCPTPQTLAKYLSGKLTPQRANEIEEHLQFCQRCVDRADTESGGVDLLVQAMRRSLSSDALFEEPELAAALFAIRGIRTSDGDAEKPTALLNAPVTPSVRDYQLIEKLGEGGMGMVYRAIHTRLGKTVAFKVLKPDCQQQSQAVERFEREMRALGSLEHPNIVRALDAGEEQGMYFLVMEYIDGVDLAKLGVSLGKLAIADACEIVRQAALGLAHAHHHQKVHRDVKPGNLMLSTDGVVKVLDLGLAQLRGPLDVGDELTRQNQVMGTYAYMSPEQLMGAKDVTPSTDIYSLGVTFYQFLAGGLPLKKGQFALQLPPLEQQRPGIPPPIMQIVQAMMSREPDDRVASMQAVAQLLMPHAAGANLPNLLRRYGDSNVHTSLPVTLTPDGGLGPDSLAVPSALQQTATRNTTARAPQLSTPPTPPPVVKEFATTRTQVRKRLTIAGGIAVVAAIFFAVSVLRFWPEPDGTVLVQVAPAQRKWLNLNDLGLFVVPVSEGEDADGIRLSLGSNPLPQGTYRIKTSDPNIDVSVAGQATPATLTVTEGTIALQIAVRAGTLTLQVGSELMGEVLDTANGPGIFAVPAAGHDGTEGIRLKEGDNALPAGEYRLVTSAWMLDFTVQGKAAPPVLSVKPDRQLFLSGNNRTNFPWSLPELPTTRGAFAESYGELRRVGAAGAEVRLPYNLRLTVLDDEVDVGGVPHRWLEVMVTTAPTGDKYVETGYLLIDSEQYRNRRKLRVARGWITASTPALQRQLESLYPDNSPDDAPDETPDMLVVAFDPKQDALGEFTKRNRNLDFPDDRVSVQEAVALLFEADFEGGLPREVQGLRAEIASLRKLHFESVEGPFGTLACLVVRAEVPNERTPDGPLLVPYILKRAENVPFSFVSIDVKSEKFGGTFHLKDYDADPALGATSSAPDEVQLQKWADIFIVPPGTNSRGDVVSLPENAGAVQRFTGQLVVPRKFFHPSSTQVEPVTVYYDVDLWVGAAEAIEGIAWRPMAVVVKSGPGGVAEWTEKAWLWIDDTSYRKKFRFVVDPDRSFVEVGGEVFPYLDKNATLVDDLHRLRHPPPAERIGIYDALALLCGNNHPAAPNFTKLRAFIDADFLASGEQRKVEPQELKLPDGNDAWGERWTTPFKVTQTTYYIDRTASLPYGIHSVYLKQPAMHLEFTARVKHFAETGEPAIVAGDDWWQSKATLTAKRIAELPINFCLWKRADDSIIAWAEYLAEDDTHVALRDANGDTLVVKVTELSAEQLNDRRVRTWTDNDGKETLKLEYLGSKWLRKRGKLGEVEDYKFNPKRYSATDVEWLSNHELAVKHLRTLAGKRNQR